MISAFRIACFFSLFIGVAAHAQVGNEWINFSQSYYKIPVAKEGIYRLTYGDLQAAGFPTNADPTRIQLFHRGIEQALYIQGEGDAQLDPSDFLEFYGMANDGTLDAELYQPNDIQPHKLYNLYSDTTSYFLTVGGSLGKRMNVQLDAPGALVPRTFHYDEKLLVQTDNYAEGVDYGEILNTFSDIGEGFCGVRIFQNQAVDYKITGITQGVVAAGKPQLEIMLVGRGPMQHRGEILANGRVVNEQNFFGYIPYQFTAPLEWSDIAGDGSVTITIRALGVGGAADRFSAMYIRLRYPQQYDAANATQKYFELAPDAAGKSYIKIANAPAGTRLFDVTDENTTAIVSATATTTLDAVVLDTDEGKKIFASNTTITPTIKPVNFRQMFPSQHNYIIITHPLLRKPAGGYSDPVKAYADYRGSVEGGGYDTLLVNIQQLYDQFSYGEQTPVAIYRFMKFLANVNVPKYLLLAGRGLTVDYRYYRNPQAYLPYLDLVPTAGYPGADMPFTVGIAGTTYAPAVPTGRIPAMKPEDVANYLDKVKEMEARPYDALWRKNLLHLSGGIEEGEPARFQQYMKDFQAKAESYHLGGNVSALAKYSKEVQHVNIAEQVNNGLGLVTFFGHASASTLDFDVGYVTDPVLGYNNKGKYPMLLMNGCNAGAFFMSYVLFGEDWVKAKDKGATAFIGHSSFGFSNLLKLYTDTFYEVGYEDPAYIKLGVGDIQKETARRYMVSAFESPANVTQVQQMVLLGDPAARLFGARKPDIEINDNNVSIESFDGKGVTALSDSFAIKMIVRNFGIANNDTTRVEVTRTLNDNSVIVYDSLYPTPKYSDTLMFVIRKGREAGFGNNTFRVVLDPDNVIDELNEDNNTTSKTLYISLNGTKNLFPAPYAIVNTPSVGLTFQTTDLLSGEREFLLEVDTAYTFDSEYRKQFTVKGQVLARKDLELVVADTLAYYWRTKLTNPKPGESAEWTVSSFTYIDNGPEGWAQVDFPQYLENGDFGLVKDATQQKLEFKETTTTLAVKTFGSGVPDPYWKVSVKIAGAEYNLITQGFVCRTNSINLIAFDRRSTAPYIGVPFKWYNRGGRACGREPWVINSFAHYDMVTGNNDDIIQYVNNIAVGDSVLLYSMGNAYYSYWPAAAKIKLGELGISVAQLDALQDVQPAVILGRKGAAPGTAKVFTTSATPLEQQYVNMTGTITGGYSEGNMTSVTIGPALAWSKLTVNTSDVGATDQVSFDIVGQALDGSTQLLSDNVTGNQDLTTISAGEYPYLKIVFNTTDDVQLTSAQLNSWIVAYTPAPEGLLLYKGTAEQVQLNEGDTWNGDFGFINIGNKPFTDSLTVRYETFNQPARVAGQQLFRIKAPAPGDTTAFTVSMSGAGHTGLNDVDVFVNPHVLPEQYYDNNILQLNNYINVQRDLFKPVLDVTVDGRHLANGDFVSPNPAIVAKLWDEESALLKTDLAGVKIFLTYPCDQPSCDPTVIDLNGGQVKWHAATDTSAFRIEFNPTQLPDGEYTLRIEGADAVGNTSGTVPYEVMFVVDAETTVEVLGPYPNPFRYATFFNIVIGGQAVPEQAQLIFANVSGQQVVNYPMESLPPLHIGSNEVEWKGTDARGISLPNGVYVYKLVLTVNGQQHTRYGKVVLVR